MNNHTGRTGRMLVVSNRLPFTVVERGGELTFKESGGGLVSGIKTYLESLQPASSRADYVWVGWPGSAVEGEMATRLKAIAISDFSSYPVFLSEVEMENFYHGFCNKIIWPLFHYFPSYAIYRDEYWSHYRRVNEVFCEALMEVVRPGDTVWIHDYHLMLLPRMIRDNMPDLPVGFFLHIPFPSFEVFRLLPGEWRRGILQGLLGADLIGFHTHDYAQYFQRCVLRILGFEHNMGQIVDRERIVKVGTFPMGIDFDKFNSAASRPEVRQEMNDMKRGLETVKVVLSIDRLDYAKGIINRLQGYELFLESCPEWHRKVILNLVMTPSRIGVEHYQQTKKNVEELVGRINGRFGSLQWVPVVYQYQSFSFDSLAALYGVSDVALITPLRDGMNLIAKEYIASRAEGKGVLILSEMAGAAKELGEAVIINPNSRDEIASALKEALEMDEEEQIRRNRVMQERLRRYDIMRWARDFIEELEKIKGVQERFATRLLSPAIQERMTRDYREAERRLLLLDYDGTLVPFAKDPRAVSPTESLLELLRSLLEDPGNNLVLISGRNKETLQAWFGHLPIGLVAEHGVWTRKPGREWRMIKPLSNDWKPSILPILEMYIDRLPGSFIEEKEFSYAWHFRAADPELGPVRAKELMEHLVDFTANIEVQVLQGNKVIEVKSAGVNKGTAGLYWIAETRPDFILSVGDDFTDEHLFMALPESAHSIRVGITQTYARYNVTGYEEVLQLLEQLAHGSGAGWEVEHSGATTR